jgi:DNA polymerase III epsilon subunit-like protein
MLWSEAAIHVIDFEGCLRTGIVEFGVVTLRGGEVVDWHGRLCRPAAPIGALEFAVHGIRDEEAAQQKPFSEEWDLFAGLRASGPLAAHFASTEERLLKAVWPYPRVSPDFLRGGSLAEWGPWIDTGRIAPAALPGAGSARLEDTVAALGLDAEVQRWAAQICPPGRAKYHCALFDALAAALALREAAMRLEGPTLRRLLQLSAASVAERHEREQGQLF